MYDTSNPNKVYVRANVWFDDNGSMLPNAIIWEDGCKYDIDRVTDVRQAAALRAGGMGRRYTVWVNGRSSYLFFERNYARSEDSIGRWFVERK